MKTNNKFSAENVISTANVQVKNFQKSLRDANKEFTSLSRVLRVVQCADLMKAGYSDCFAAVGFPTDRKVTAAMVFAALAQEQWVETVIKSGERKGETERTAGLWGYKQVVVDGVKQVDEKGAPVVEPCLRKITAWTPTKLFKLLAQAQAINTKKA